MAREGRRSVWIVLNSILVPLAMAVWKTRDSDPGCYLPEAKTWRSAQELARSFDMGHHANLR